MNYAKERREFLIRYLVRVAMTAEYLTANQLRVVRRVIHKLEMKNSGFDRYERI